MRGVFERRLRPEPAAMVSARATAAMLVGAVGLVACQAIAGLEDISYEPGANQPAYYVAPGGDDQGPGSHSRPWRTIGRGVRGLKPGDTLYVRGGTYVESVYLQASGTKAAPIRVLAYPGEAPVVDGESRLPTGEAGSLIDVYGDYVELSGLEVRNSNFSVVTRGISLYAQHATVRNTAVHHVSEIGIYVAGDDSTVEDCRVWQARGQGLFVGRDFFGDKVTARATVRRSTSFNSGIGVFVSQASDLTVEDNVVFNNSTHNLRLVNAWNSAVRRNLAFVSDDSPVQGAPRNLTWSDDVVTVGGVPALSHDNTIVNNILWVGGVCLMCESSATASGAGAALKNVTFAHNTMAKGSFKLGTQTHSGSRVVNNILPAGTDASLPGVTSERNFAGDPGFTGIPAFTNTSYSADWFKLTPASRDVVDAALPGVVTDDFFGAARPTGAGPDIGAHELQR